MKMHGGGNGLEKVNKAKYASVRILDVPYHADRPYDYYIPSDLWDSVCEGCFVSVPFGRGNRNVGAVVTSLSESTEYDEAKPIAAVSAGGALLDSEAISLCRFLCDYTLCTFGEAVRCAVPSAALSKLDEYLTVTDSEKGLAKLSEKALIFYTYIKARGTVSRGKLKSQFGDEAATLTASLVKLGLVKKEARVKEATNFKYITYISLKDKTEALKAAEKTRSPIQREIILLLSKIGRAGADELEMRIGKNVKAQLSTLEKKGIIFVERIESYRNPYIGNCQNKGSEPPLSKEQTVAYDTLSQLYRSDSAKAALLHGVTGSGKTRVIKEMIDLVIADGKGVIMLVPEISLTPQTVGYFCSMYGDRVAVIHSNLSQGERFDAWKRIKKGEASVVIGTRSAIFAPLKNIGMIVIDEEQEHTYKSDTDPKYLAHDVARYRAGKHNCLMLLSSATPSLASYHKAVSGVYTLVEMKNRVGRAALPQVMISDMRFEGDAGNVSPVGTVLRESLCRVYAEGKQSIVFLNRRGYNSAVSCRVCGEAINCPSCSVSLTYHTKMPLGETDDAKAYLRMRSERGVLTCHYCGYKTKLPELCPSCKAEHFRFVGCGTQKAQEEIEKAVPGARVIRMDMDTTTTKNSHSEILEKFRKGEADILLGTQMVTKGHDFPAVTLVGVMNADSSLYLDDFKASEKTFSMLTQVVGRAGRGNDPGMAVIQTSNPDSQIIRLAAMQDYKSFYESEIKLRKALVFPPFCDIGVITLSGSDEALLSAGALKLAGRTKELLSGEYSDVEAVVFGPFEAPVYKVQNTCRMRLVIKCRLNRRARHFIAQLLYEFGRSGARNLNISADLNPSSL